MGEGIFMLPCRIVFALALLSLSACATLDGRPTPVITVAFADSMVAAYPPDQAIQTLGSIPANDVAGRNTYRNRVVMAYLTAIDAHHGMFLRNLSRSGKSAHLGADILLLGLTGAGSIFDKAAAELAAGATGVAGARSSFDRELLADKTLPILISLMDSRRLSVRADIVRGLSKPEGTYTLEDAFADLMRYESAGSIDAALSEAANAAGERAQETQYDFSQARDLCVVDDATDTARRTLMQDLEQFEKDAEDATDAAVATTKRQSIQKAAQALGIDAQAVPKDKAASFALLQPIRDQVEAQCNAAGVDALRVKLKNAGVPLP
jgi:hypothetical protein